MLDVNGQSIGDGTLELVKFAETASAVNELTITNSATGNAPEIAATGDDTNIDLKLTPKGTGKLNLDGIKFPNADGSSGQALTTNGSGILSFSTISADGTADWDTSVKTTGFTATANKGYFCNTTTAGFTVTLPATPSAGDEIIILDYAGTFDTFALTISPNGNKIEGATANLALTGEREGARLVYIDSTQGWLAYSGINEGTDALSPAAYSVDFLVVAGGGGTTGNRQGGGGAGGFRTSTQSVLQGTVITVTVGEGGTGGGSSGTVTATQDGSNSSISGSGLTTITSTGGGGAGQAQGRDGGSGGGSSNATINFFPGGSGNTPSTSPSQGNNGGASISPYTTGSAGGGGGAGATGSPNASGTTGGNGGNGTASSITGTSVTYAGGGGGGGSSGGSNTTGGSGGGGIGRAGAPSTQLAGDNGTVNTGGGGGGGSDYSVTDVTQSSGGKGVVVLAMPLANFSGTVTGSPTQSDNGTTKRLVFNGSGSYTA
jgi:hypothetical protein